MISKKILKNPLDGNEVECTWLCVQEPIQQYIYIYITVIYTLTPK